MPSRSVVPLPPPGPSAVGRTRAVAPKREAAVASPPEPGGLVKILVAGLDKDSRGPIEAAVRHALRGRGSDESWTVSLVKVAGRWSVTLNGPNDRFRNVSLAADESQLAEAIRHVVGTEGATPPAGTVVGGPTTAARDRHSCEHCGRPFVVSYEQQPNEAKVMAAVACPHCWKIEHVEIGAWAASGRDYHAEKA